MVLMASVVGCGGTAIEPITVATPVPVSGDAEQVADADLPETTPVASETEPIELRPGPTGRLVDNQQPVQDVHGNTIAVHGVVRWPASYSALQPFTRDDVSLAGGLDQAFGSASSLSAIDLSVCAKTLGDIDIDGTTGTFTIGNALEVPSPRTGNGSSSSSDTSLAAGFTWPDTGICERGWLTVASTADFNSDLFVHYWPKGDDGQGVLAWAVPIVDAPGESETSFGPAQQVTFNSGELAGATVMIDGWAELVGAPAGPVGTRPVGLSVQGCPAENGTWPEVGLSVDQWNLGSASTRSIDGLDALTLSSSECDSGWLIFDVPNGGVVTGAFVSERPGTPGAHWSLVDAALPDPT